MKLFGFDSDDDDYDDNDEYEERRKKPAARKENSTRSASSGKLILYNVRSVVPDEDKRRLCNAFDDGAMILIDMHELSPMEFDEFGRHFITFMGGVAFGHGGDGRSIDPAQYILTPKTGMFEVWPKEDINE